MTLLLILFTALAGLAFGSFLNVCISRLPRHESVVAPRSRCPKCRAPIRSWDNIPVISWLLLRGRCRRCGKRISFRYPAIELTSAALFLLCLVHFREEPVRAIFSAILCWLLLGLAATDAETMLLPDALTLPGIGLGVVQSGLADDWPVFGWRLAAMALFWAGCAAALILLIRGLYWLARRREGIGLGDAKLLAMIAAWLGPWPTLLTLFLAVIGAAAYGLTLLALRTTRKTEADSAASVVRIPLGAFLGAAAIFTVFEGGNVLGWYFGFFR